MKNQKSNAELNDKNVMLGKIETFCSFFRYDL